MDHFIRIYHEEAAAYHAMIAREDVDQRVRVALVASGALEARRLLDLGTGTGRIPLLLHEDVPYIVAFDLHEAMLREQVRQRASVSGRWPLLQGDMRHLPFATGEFDLVTAGWALGHFCGWYGDKWQVEMQQVLSEMRRVVQPGGQLIILETLSTGSLEPKPPTPELARYYAWLEAAWGFQRHELQTDYQFASPEDAVAHAEFFFGPELATAIRTHGWARLPEWTGFWHWQAPKGV